MQYRKLVSVCLAFLLVFSCYPLSVAYADDEGFFDGRFGKAAIANDKEQYEADSDGREATAQDTGAAEGQEGDSSPFSEEVVINYDGFESGNSIGADGIESGQLALSSGTGTAYLSGSLSGNGGNLPYSSGIGGKESNYEGQSNLQLDSGGRSSLSGDSNGSDPLDRYKTDGGGALPLYGGGEVQQVDISNSQARVAPIAAILPYLGSFLGVTGTVVNIGAALVTIFGNSMGKTEGLLAIIANTLLASHEQLRGIETSASNLDRVFAQVYSSDFSYISDIYDKTNLLSVVFANDNSVFNTRFTRLLVAMENASKYSYNLSEVFFNSNSVFNTRFVRLLVATEGINSNLASFISENAGWYVRQGRILGAIESFTSENAGWYTRLGRITGALDNLDSSISAFTSENAGWYTRFARLLNASEGIYSLLLAYLPKLSVPEVSVSFDDNDLGAILSSIDGVKDAIMLNAAVDFVDTVVGDFSSVVDAAQASTLETTMQAAFPFCIPVIAKQLLGLLQADPVPPSFDILIGGEVMHVDATQMQGFADLVSWACRFLFVFGLLFASRRFIFWEVVK